MSISSISTDVSSFLRRLVRVALGCMIAFAAVACGSDDPYNADAVELTFEDSPINQMLGIDIALRAGDLVQLEREAEAGIAECMKREGFEYLPIDFAAQFGPSDGGADPDTRAYAEANGYGISIRPFDAPAPDEIVDPNDEIRNQLSDAELQAYELALFGEPPAEGEAVSLEDQTGCFAEAYEEVFAAEAQLGSVERFFGEFGDELTELEDRFRADPRYLELESQWATCMSAAGFNVATREEIFVELNRRMSDVGAALEPGEEPSAEIEAQMDAVRDWERSVAVAEWDCNEPIEGELKRLRYGYEALFIDVHRDDIEADA